MFVIFILSFKMEFVVIYLKKKWNDFWLYYKKLWVLYELNLIWLYKYCWIVDIMYLIKFNLNSIL